MGTNQRDSTSHNAVNSFLSHGDKQPSLYRLVLQSVLKATVGAGLFQKTVIVANNGVQSHRGRPASNTRNSSTADIIPGFLLVTCTFCTASCAKDIGGETCHMSPAHS